jgi:hypothetical protein
MTTLKRNLNLEKITEILQTIFTLQNHHLQRNAFYSVAKLKKTNFSHLLSLDFNKIPNINIVPFYYGHPVLFLICA